MFTKYTYKSAFGDCRECDGCMLCQEYEEDDEPEDYDDVIYDRYADR